MNIHTTAVTIEIWQDFLMYARPADILECEIMVGKPFGELLLSDMATAEALIDEDTKEVYAIGGIDKTEESGGLVWMICTQRVEQHPTAFLRVMKRILKERQKEYKLLFNYVWLGNPLHISWLKWMGAQMGAVLPIGANGERFAYFEIKA